MKKTYFAWMLRVNQVGSSENRAWRASLEDPQTRERIGFDDMEALYEYIRRSLEATESDTNSGTIP